MLFRKKLKPIDEIYVFDKAKYHQDSIEEDLLQEDQAYVHTGMFLAWLTNNDLCSEELNIESIQTIRKIKNREVSPATLYMEWDGCLIGDMLNQIGYNFALDYFDFENGAYLSDYEKLLESDDASIFGQPNTWEMYDRLSSIIGQRFSAWKKKYKLI